MRVAFDARHANRGLGIGAVAVELARALIALGDVELIWLGSPEAAPPGVAEVVSLRGWPYPALEHAPGVRLVRRLGPDVMHFTGNTGWMRRPRDAPPSVLTVHDLIFMRTVIQDRSLRQVVGHRYERVTVPRAIRAAAAVVSPSDATADDVAETFGAHSRPTVIHNGIRLPSDISCAVPGARPYVVAFGGRDPRKNLMLALRAWRSSVPEGERLVVLSGAGVPAGFAEAAGPEIEDGRVQLTGYVSRDELWRLLSGARAVLYPTKDEGFGLPVLEALAAGTPCITGLAPVTRDVAGGAALLIDAARPEASIADLLQRVRSEPDLRDQLARTGRRRAREFGWERAAVAYRDVYRRAAAT